jgi:hypothetical protein
MDTDITRPPPIPRQYFAYEVLKNRVNTKELYTFKMIQKTNAAYLERHTTSWPL